MSFRLPDCPASTPLALPGSAVARALPDLTPTLATQLAHEREGRDNIIDPRFFDCMQQRTLVEYSWPDAGQPPNRYPMPHSDVSAIAASFAVSLADLRPLLPQSRRLQPLRITPWHGLLVVMACHHHRSGLGRYQEFGILVPMFLDRRRLLPPLPLRLRAPDFAGQTPLGLVALDLPVDRERPAESGRRLAGLPHLLAHAEFALGSQTGLASMEIDGQRVAALEVAAPSTYSPQLMDLSFTQFSIFEGRIIRMRNAVISEGYRGSRGSAKVEFGEHPRFARYRALRLLKRPVETRISVRQNWISGTPEDLGPA